MTRKHMLYPALALALLTSYQPVFAGGLNDVGASFSTNANAIATQLGGYGMTVFGAFVIIQWFLDNWKMAIQGPEIPQLLAKIAGSILWIGFCLSTIHSTTSWINSIYNFFANASPITLDADYILSLGVTLAKNMGEAVSQNGLWDTLKNIFPAIILAICAIIVLLCFSFAAISVVMVKAELAMVIAVAPVTVILMGFRPLRDSGIAPFKSAMSLGIRALILGVICSIMATTATDWANSIASMDKQFTQAYTIAGSSLLFIAMIFNAGKIAAAIASGSAALDGSTGLMAAMQTVNTAANLGKAAAGMAMGMASMAKGMNNLAKSLGAGGASAAGGALGAISDMMRGNGMRNAGGSELNNPAARKMADDILSGMKDQPQGGSGSGSSDFGGFNAGQGNQAAGDSTQSSSSGEPTRFDKTADGRPASPTIPEAAQAAQAAETSQPSQLNQPIGNGSTASIGGAEQAQGGQQNQLDSLHQKIDKMNEQKKPTLWDHAKQTMSSSRDALEQQARAGDGHMVSVQVNSHNGGGE